MEKHSIGKTISALRRERGMTQAELAEKLFVTDKAVSKWEQDVSYPSTEILPALATLFDVSIDYLMTGKGVTPSAGEATEESAEIQKPDEPVPPITVVVKKDGEDDLKQETILSDIERESLNVAKRMYKYGELTSDQYEAQRRRILTGNNPIGFVRDGKGRDRKLIRRAPWHFIVYGMTIVLFALAILFFVKGCMTVGVQSSDGFFIAFGVMFGLGLSHICFSARINDGATFGWIVLSIISLGVFAIIRSLVAVVSTATAISAGLKYTVS